MEDVVDALVKAMPGFVMLLNRQRQIISVNSSLLCASGMLDIQSLVGMRPGEALDCIYACDGSDGCGTGEHCSVCGAVQAIVNSQSTNTQDMRECRITLDGEPGNALDVQALATPVSIGGQMFTLLSLIDISAEKRREQLERVFFHDVINTAGGIYGLASMLAEHDEGEVALNSEYKQWLVALSGNLIEELRAQRRLLDAERGDFVPEYVPVDVRTLIEELYSLYRHHERTPGRELVCGEVADCRVVSDAAVIRRIVGNMVLNGLEATPRGGRVTLSASCDGKELTFAVHNPGEIPRDVQLQIFSRSFSTKSKSGRGIGTYSMKLFGERYLKGRVAFRSTQQEGTLFTFTLPVGG